MKMSGWASKPAGLGVMDDDLPPDAMSINFGDDLELWPSRRVRDLCFSSCSSCIMNSCNGICKHNCNLYECTMHPVSCSQKNHYKSLSSTYLSRYSFRLRWWVLWFIVSGNPILRMLVWICVGVKCWYLFVDLGADGGGSGEVALQLRVDLGEAAHHTLRHPEDLRPRREAVLVQQVQEHGQLVHVLLYNNPSC